MSQEASTNLLVPQASDELITNESWSIDNSADGLMDELFADLDNALEGKGERLSNQTVRREYAPLQTYTVEKLFVPDTYIPNNTQQTHQSNNNQANKTVVETPAVGKRVKKVKNTKEKRYFFGKLVTLAAALGLSIAGVVWLLQSGILNGFGRLTAATQLAIKETKPKAPTKAEVESDLVKYMLGALAAIDRQEAKALQAPVSKVLSSQLPPQLVVNKTGNQTQVAFAAIRPSANIPIAKAGTPVGNLPPVVAANQTPPGPARSTIVERIYIPVYQAPPPMRYAPPTIASLPRKLPHPLPSAPKIAAKSVLKTPTIKTPDHVKTAINTVKKATKPVAIIAAAVPGIKPVNIQSKPITISQPSRPVPILAAMPSKVISPKLPTVRAIAPTTPVVAKPKRNIEIVPIAALQIPPLPPSPSTSKSKSETTEDIQQEIRQETTRQEKVATSVATAPVHELQGVMDLGEKSAALFKVDGITRRIEIGEGIAASGWKLVEVTNNEAIIRRNGEVRSIFAGQKF
jgi:hypothetical protein